jgi:Carboxypeptidase regulatory-like domain
MEGTSSPTRARHGHRSLASAIAAVLFAVLLVAASSAGADPWPLHGTVTSSGDPVAGAFVAVTGEGGQATDVTDGTGAWSVDLPDGTYDVAVQAPGYRVTQEDATIAGAGTTLDLGLTSSGAKFDVLPVYGAQVGSILSGGSPGVFYIATSAPSRSCTGAATTAAPGRR